MGKKEKKTLKKNINKSNKKGRKRTMKFKKINYSTKCENMKASLFNRYVENKILVKRIPKSYKENVLKNNLFLDHRGNISNINSDKWTSKMRKQYKKIREKFGMKPNSKEWLEFKERYKCNVFRNIQKNVNTRVIGILSIPTNTGATLGATSYIPQSYVKWVEEQGARVVPIQYDLPIPIINGLLNQIDGLLLIGGTIEGIVVEKHHYKFLSSLQYIVSKITHFNLIGNYFPIFSICLGFELLPIVAMHDDVSVQSDCFINHKQITIFRDVGPRSMKFTQISNDEKNIMISKPMQEEFTEEEKKKIGKNESVFMFHNKSFMMDEKYMKEYEDFLKVTAYTEKNGRKYISMYQFKSLPFYGVQFHPEKVLYEWLQEGIPHNETAIMVSKKLSSMFINECGKNYNTNILAGNNDTNYFIENYDLLSRDNAIKVLYPHKSKAVNMSMMSASYYFGRTDNIKSEYLNIPVTSLSKSIRSKDEHKLMKEIEEQLEKEKTMNEI